MKNFKIKDLMISIQPGFHADNVHKAEGFNLGGLSYDGGCFAGTKCSATKPDCFAASKCSSTRPNCMATTKCSGTRPTKFFDGNTIKELGQQLSASAGLHQLKQQLAGMQAKKNHS